MTPKKNGKSGKKNTKPSDLPLTRAKAKNVKGGGSPEIAFQDMQMRKLSK